jgi:hypothetical protein
MIYLYANVYFVLCGWLGVYIATRKKYRHAFIPVKRNMIWSFLICPIMVVAYFIAAPLLLVMYLPTAMDAAYIRYIGSSDADERKP